MPISESQFETWSHQGAVATARLTHESIREALKRHRWPDVMRWDAYLQGSYKNTTNIRGNSDVDLVVEGGPSFYYKGLTEEARRELKIGPASFSFSEFRNEVLAALASHYDGELIDSMSSDKCIRVVGQNGRLTADVIPCMEYRKYRGTSIESTGMTFFTVPGDNQIVNYPKLHHLNGEAKNGDYRTWGRYKPMVRVFKNAREAFDGDVDNYPSYFIECLMFNVPDEYYLPEFSSAYVAIVGYLANVDLSLFMTQSGQEWLFGDCSTQWRQADAKEFVAKLADLWTQW